MARTAGDAMGACPSCGAPIGREQKTCRRCGADLSFWAAEHSGLQDAEHQEMEDVDRREEAVDR